MPKPKITHKLVSQIHDQLVDSRSNINNTLRVIDYNIADSKGLCACGVGDAFHIVNGRKVCQVCKRAYDANIQPKQATA